MAALVLFCATDRAACPLFSRTAARTTRRIQKTEQKKRGMEQKESEGKFYYVHSPDKEKIVNAIDIVSHWKNYIKNAFPPSTLTVNVGNQTKYYCEYKKNGNYHGPKVEIEKCRKNR